MNRNNSSNARSLMVAGLAAMTATSVLAQVAYNRTVRPEDITITPVASVPGGGSSITLRPGAINKSSSEVDLGSDITVTLNGVPIATFARIIFVWHTGGICTPDLATCNGQCFISSSCRRDWVGDCACHSYYDLVVPGPVAVNNGDVVGLHITAAAGASPEVFTDDDSAYKTVHTACAADVNGSGGLSVQDIFDFLAEYFAGGSAADFNGSGSLSVQDIFDFLAAYFAGCV